MHGIRGGENHQLHLTANSMTYNGDMPTRYSNALVVKPLEDESTIILMSVKNVLFKMESMSDMLMSART